MAVRLFLELYPYHLQKANWGLLRRDPGDMATSENLSLKHVADVIREEEIQQSWLEMQSVRVFERGSQEPVQQAPVQLSPIRPERWPTKKARYSHTMTYVRPSAVRPPPTMRAAASQAVAAVPAAKLPAYSCWGCG